MKNEELLSMCSAFIRDYFQSNSKEVAENLLNGINKSDDLSTAQWKIAVNAAEYSCQIAVMTTISILSTLGAIDVPGSDELELQQDKGFLS